MVLQYRSDIDGLRAVAVLSVVFFHLNIELFQGGYTGVDVFFVISGYLITSILKKNIENHRFSFVEFFARRVRRIFPALLSTLVFTSCLCLLFYNQKDIAAYTDDLLWTLGFASNFQFASAVGYFDLPADQKLLLHTWSLAVEEQFYIFWPLFIWGLYKFTSSQKVIANFLVFTVFVSFCYSEYTLFQGQTLTGFYMLPSRIWELGMGSLLAFKSPHLKKTSSFLVTLSGMALLALSFLWLDSYKSFPGINALYSVAGTALIIIGGLRANAVSTLLSNRVFVYFGRRSFSLYLIHWPLVVLAHYIGFTQMWLVFLLSVALTEVQYRIVENPIRKMQIQRPFRFLSVGLSSLFLVGIIFKFAVAPIDMSLVSAKELKRLNSYVYEKYPDKIDCFDRAHLFDADGACNVGDKENFISYQWVAFGDSHTTNYLGALSNLAIQNQKTLRQFSASLCPPLLNTPVYDMKSGMLEERCLEFVKKFKAFVQSQSQIEVVFLAARWSFFLEESGFYPEKIFSAKSYIKTQSQRNSKTEKAQVFSNGLMETIQWLKQKNIQVVLLKQIPPHGRDLRGCFLLRESLAHLGIDCSTSRKMVDERFQHTDVVFQRVLTDQPNAAIFDPLPSLCNSEKCVSARAGTFLYSDGNHLNLKGSRRLSEDVRSFLKQKSIL